MGLLVGGSPDPIYCIYRGLYNNMFFVFVSEILGGLGSIAYIIKSNGGFEFQENRVS